MIKYLHDKCAEIYDEVFEGSTNTLKVIIEKICNWPQFSKDDHRLLHQRISCTNMYHNVINRRKNVG